MAPRTEHGLAGWADARERGRCLVDDESAARLACRLCGRRVFSAGIDAVTNNIIPDNSWAVMGSGAAAGSDTLAKYFPGASFQRNVIVGANAAAYPGNNFYPPTISAVMFTDLAGGNYALSSTSPYRSAATDGADVGCLVDRLRRP